MTSTDMGTHVHLYHTHMNLPMKTHTGVGVGGLDMVCPPRVHSRRHGRHGGLLRGRGSREMVRSLRINVLERTQVRSLGKGLL